MHRLAVNALTIIAFADALTFVDIRDMTVSCMTFNVYNPRLSDGVTPGNSLYVPKRGKEKVLAGRSRFKCLDRRERARGMVPDHVLQVRALTLYEPT